MRVRFNFPRVLNGMLYAPGDYEVPSQLLADWFFQALVKAGDISYVEAPQALQTESMDASPVIKDEPEAVAVAEVAKLAAPQSQQRRAK